VARKRPTRTVGDSETLYRDLFENANDMIATFTLDGTITSVNRGLEVMLGWSRDELIGHHYRKLATPAALALADERTRRALAGEQLPSIFEAEIVRKDGRVVPIEVRARFIRNAKGKPIGVQGIFRDITERKQMEEAVRQSEERYRSMFEACPDFVYLSDPSGRILDANPALVRWVGSSLGVLRGKHFLDFFAGDNRDELLRKAADLVRGVPVRELVVRARNAQGEIREYEVNAIPLHDQHGTVTAILSIARDVTARREAERTLRESQLLRARIADTIPELVYVYDLQAHQTRMVNRQITAVLGYAPEDVQEKSGPLFGDLLHADDVAAFIARATHWLTAATGASVESEYRVRHFNGEYRWLHSRETVLTRTPEGVPQEILGMARDVTDRKRIGQLFQQRTITPKEVGRRLQRFRESLKLTQAEFGTQFGGYNQQQISNYEIGRVELPLELLLTMRAQGYPLEVVLGEGSTEALEETIVYLSASYRERVVSRQLASVLTQLLDRDIARMERALREVDRPLPALVGEQRRVVEQVADLEKLTG
jgi:PAS domain S-box-containing protein